MTEKENKLFEQAVEYFNKKDYDKSKVLYEEILKINSKSSNVYGNLGVIYKIKGDINTAVKCYVEAIKLNPKNLLFYLSLFTVVLTGDVSFIFKFALGIWMTLMVFVWDVAIIYFLSTNQVRKKFSKAAYYIDKFTGALLGIMGLAIVRSALTK